MKLRIHRYILREMIPPFLASILVFSLVLILGRIMQLMDMIMNRGVSVWDVLRLIVSIQPYFLVFVLPMATLMAVLLAFLRLGSDNEIVSLKNAGLSLYQLLPPVAVFALFTFGTMLFISLVALPWGYRTTRQTIRKIVQAHAEVALKEGVFNEVFGKIVVYMGKYHPRKKLMEDILISDDRDPRIQNTIVAEKGYFIPDAEEGGVLFRIFNGVISRVDPGLDSTQTITFNRYTLHVRLDDLRGLGASSAGRDRIKPKEMTLAQLRGVIRTGRPGSERHQMALMEYHQRFALPVACWIMALLGMALGVECSGARKSWGMITGLFVFFVYFILLSATKSLGEGNHVPVVAGTWAPNVLFGALGLFLLVRSAREQPFPLVNRLLGILAAPRSSHAFRHEDRPPAER